MVEVSITYETLFDLLRREKSRNELQELDKDFYNHVNEYISQKNAMLTNTQKLQSSAEKEKIEIQLKNAQKIIKEFFEVRQKKILNHAVNKVKTGSSMLASSNLLDLEKNFFDNACELLAQHQKKQARAILTSSTIVKSDPQEDTDVSENIPVKEPEEESKGNKMYKVKFSSDLPKFVGLDKNVYGPFSKGEVSELPEKITNLLLNKGRVELL